MKTRPSTTLAALLILAAPSNAQPAARMGVMVGEVTATGALVQVRLTGAAEPADGDVPGAPGVVRFRLTPAGASGGPVQVVPAAAGRDFVARAAFGDLRPGTRYRCQTQIGTSAENLTDGPAAEFRTLPGAKASEPASFVVVTGMNYAKFHGDGRIDRKRHKVENNTDLPPPYRGADKPLGYPALATILKMRPHFFVGTGDNVYYDTPKKPRAKTVAEMRRKWHRQFAQPRYVDLFAKVPTYWEVDDHDYRVDDCDNTGDYKPSPAEARRVLLEQLPIADAKAREPRTYRTRRVSRELQIWLPENRMYRSPNKTPDGPKKTIWGAGQKAWLKKTLLESDAAFKVLISPTPMVGPDDARKRDNHTNFGGFRHERDEFFAWLKAAGLLKQNFLVICGDRHWQYHAIHPSGVEEFSCGALVDANSRPGRKAGDPKSTDPRGRIRQPYLQTKPSGGFLHVEVRPAKGGTPSQLALSHFDERGKLLNRHVKTAK